MQQRRQVPASSPSIQDGSAPQPALMDEEQVFWNNLDPQEEEGTGSASGEQRSGVSLTWGGLQLEDDAPQQPPVETDPPIFVLCSTQEPADAAGCTADLTNGDLIDANTFYVKIDARRNRWLHVGQLSSTDRETVVGWLQAANGQFTMRGSNVLVCGETTETPHLSADTEDPQVVLDRANARAGDGSEDAQVWDFLNGGETVLNAEDADPSGWQSGQVKPAAWYNGYTVADGQVSAHRSALDTREDAAPELTLDDLKALIMRCMDAGGIRAALGDSHDTFVEALRTRFAEGHPLGEQAFTALCDELWSYLQTGAGPDGEVDIAQLQACVRALSPDTQVSAETNTPFDGPQFTLPGTDVKLASGDGIFGRATMLSLMHLFGAFSKTIREPPEINLNPAGLFDDNDYFVHDRSGSMMGNDNDGPWPVVRDAVDQSQGWEPGAGLESRTVGTFGERGVTVGDTPMTDMGDALEKAYTTLFPEDTREDRKAFAALFNVGFRDIFDDDGLDTRALMIAIGDGNGTGLGAAGESSLKAMLFTLTHPESLPADHPLRIRVEQGTEDPSQDPVRLNAVADEPEQSLEYLEVVRALAAKLNVDVRIIAVPTDGRANIQQDPVGNLIFIDLDGVNINPDNTATVSYVQGGVPQTEDIRITNPGPSNSAGRFRNARLKLNSAQRVQGESR